MLETVGATIPENLPAQYEKGQEQEIVPDLKTALERFVRRAAYLNRYMPPNNFDEFGVDLSLLPWAQYILNFEEFVRLNEGVLEQHFLESFEELKNAFLASDYEDRTVRLSKFFSALGALDVEGKTGLYKTPTALEKALQSKGWDCPSPKNLPKNMDDIMAQSGVREVYYHLKARALRNEGHRRAEGALLRDEAPSSEEYVTSRIADILMKLGSDVELNDEEDKDRAEKPTRGREAGGRKQSRSTLTPLDIIWTCAVYQASSPKGRRLTQNDIFEIQVGSLANQGFSGQKINAALYQRGHGLKQQDFPETSIAQLQNNAGIIKSSSSAPFKPSGPFKKKANPPPGDVDVTINMIDRVRSLSSAPSDEEEASQIPVSPAIDRPDTSLTNENHPYAGPPLIVEVNDPDAFEERVRAVVQELQP